MSFLILRSVTKADAYAGEAMSGPDLLLITVVRRSFPRCPGAPTRRVTGTIVLVLAACLAGCRRHAGSTTADLAETSPLNQAGGGPASREAADLYSSLYRATTGEPLAFANTSGTDIPQVDGMCLKPGTDDERQMTDAFQRANQQSHVWQQFSIPQGYKLLGQKETDTALRCIQQHGESTGCEKYRGLKVVRYLGVPGFNTLRTRALVSVIKSCGSDCGSGGVFAVRKTAAGWEREEPTDFTRNCSWAY